MMNRFLVILLLLCGGITYAQKTPVKTPAKTPVKKPIPVQTPVFKNSVDSFSYAIGLEGASYYKHQGVTQINPEMVKKAFEDIYGNKTLLLTQEQTNMTIQSKLQQLMAAKTKLQKDQAAKFFADNKKRPGVKELPSGLQYEVLKQGTGPIPKLTDTVKAHYRGTLVDGIEFDNSYSRGEPLEITVSGVIAGWTQALQIMPVGSKWKLFIPSELGYGERGAGNGKIPGGAALIFDIELIEIVHSK